MRKGVVANDSALDDAIATLEGKALFDGPECPVHVRTAQADGKLYIDLCNDAWEVVEIADDGWRVTSQCPVKFIRKEGMLPLPRPVEGGKMEQLRPFINVTDDDWLLAVAWLMAAIRPTGPYPILVVNGEHGSCKSTTCRRLRSLVDPNACRSASRPKDDQTLMIWATNSHVIALDNLSSMPTWLSDAHVPACHGRRPQRARHCTPTIPRSCSLPSGRKWSMASKMLPSEATFSTAR